MAKKSLKDVSSKTTIFTSRPERCVTWPMDYSSPVQLSHFGMGYNAKSDVQIYTLQYINSIRLKWRLCRCHEPCCIGSACIRSTFFSRVYFVYNTCLDHLINAPALFHKWHPDNWFYYNASLTNGILLWHNQSRSCPWLKISHFHKLSNVSGGAQ
jgi:hypothetical protein